MPRKNYTVGDTRDTRGSSGETPHKKHRKAERKVPVDPETEYQEEMMTDETAMMERFVMETMTIRLSEIGVDIHKPERLTDGSGKE